MDDTAGDYAWIMASSALVFMMLPGIALFYAGLRSQTTALSLLWLNMMAFSIVTTQWFLFGYSLVFSPNASSHYIGNLYNAVFKNTMGGNDFAGVQANDTPSMVFGLFQGMFAAFTMALVTGVVAERGRLMPFLIFSVFWTTFVYDPIAYWLWNSNGWANRLGALDWAGGTPVHICSGAASLAYTLMLKYVRMNSPETLSLNGQDNGHPTNPRAHRRHSAGPRVIESRLGSHNIPLAYLGCLLVWFGWFGFNAGSELKANMRATSTFVATNIAACTGGVAYTLFEQWSGQKWTGVGFCTGAFAGLVAITPGAGYVPMWAGLVFGVTAAFVCYLVLSIRRLDDFLEEPLDISIIHGAGGLWGMFLTGIFADKATAALDGTVIPGGAINGHPIQMLHQLAGGVGGFAYSFFATLILLIIIHLLSLYLFPKLALRAEPRGTDQIRLDEEELGDRDAYQIECYYHSISSEPNPQYLPHQRQRQDSGLPDPDLSDWEAKDGPATGSVPLDTFPSSTDYGVMPRQLSTAVP